MTAGYFFENINIKPRKLALLIKVFVIFLLNLSVLITLQGQGNKLYFFSLSTSDGLSQNSVSHILQDSDGIMWFATQVGVDRYDGKNFHYIKGFKKKLTEEINCLYDFDEDYVLVSTNEQLRLIEKWPQNTNDNAIIDLPIGDTLQNIIFLDKISASSQGTTLLAFTPQEITLLKQQEQELSLRKKLTFNNKLSKIQAVKCVEKNKYLFGTQDSLYILNWKGINNYEIKSLYDVNTTAIEIDTVNKYVYAGSKDLNVVRLSYQASTFKTIQDTVLTLSPKNKNIPVSDINNLLLESPDTIWVGTEKSGLYRYDFCNDQVMLCLAVAQQNNASYIASNEVLSVYRSGDNVIWVGLYALGVSLLQKGKPIFKKHYKGEYIGETRNGTDTIVHYNSYVNSILPYNKDKLLVGGKEPGVAIVDFHNDVIYNRIIAPGNPTENVLVIKQRKEDNNVYIGTHSGIYKLTPKDINSKNKGKKYQPTLFKDSVSIIEYHPGTRKWWVSLRGKDTIKVLAADFSSVDTVIVLKGEEVGIIHHVQHADSIFTMVGTIQHLYKIQNGTYKPRLCHKNTHALSILADKDSTFLWIGTDRQGILKYDFVNDTVLDSITEQGLKEEVVYAIVKDEHGYLWGTTNHGLYLIQPNSDVLKIAINHYHERDGLQSDEYNSESFASLGDSIFFFGGVKGINSLKPGNYFGQQHPHLPLVITYRYAEKENKSHYLKGLSSSASTTIKLPFKFRYLDLTPLLPYYQDPGNNQFRIRLSSDDGYKYSKDGKFTLTENNVSFNWTGVLKSKHQLYFQFRTANSGWEDIAPITIQRSHITLMNVGLFLVFFGGFILLISLFYNLWLWRRLSSFQDAINEISRLETQEEIIQKTFEHLLGYFRFQYAVFSPADYFSRTVKTTDSDYKNNKIVDPEKWAYLSQYELHENDILCQVIKKNEMVTVIGSQIVEDGFEKKGALNPDILNEFNHHQLARVYFPVIHRAYKMEGKNDANKHIKEDITLGVIEAGKRMTWINHIQNQIRFLKKWSIQENLKGRKIRLGLYADNFAQPYYRAHLKEKRKVFYEKIEQLEDKYDGHFEFIGAVLDLIIKETQAKCGNVSFRSFNYEKIGFEENDIYHGFTYTGAQQNLKKYDGINGDRKGIIEHVVETKKPYYSGKVKEDDYYIQIFDDIESELVLPMINENNFSIGVIVISSDKPNYFNQIHAYTLRKAIEKATDIYLKKKRYNTLQELTIPYNIFTASSIEIYKNAVSSLKQFFDSDYIAVWEKMPQKDKEFVLSEATTPSFKPAYEKFNYHIAYTKRNTFSKDDEIVSVQHVEDYEKKEASIYQFCKEMGFQSYVILNIIIDNKFEAFINVFSKRKIGDHEGELTIYTAKFLEQIAKKVALAIQGNKLFQSVEKISKSLLERKGEAPLNVIVKQAYELLPSSVSVVFFSKKDNTLLKVSDAVYAGEIDMDIEKDKMAHFPNWIIENGNQFIKDEQAYRIIINQVIKDFELGQGKGKNFWQRYGIKSAAAIRLSHENKHLGVMFFNYQEQKNFDQDETRSFIEAFTNLATTALLNEQYISRIEKETQKLAAQTQELKNQTKILEEETKEISFAYDRVYQKMEEMLPRATKTSYFLILQGVNHDVRNYLLKMQAKLIRLRKYISNQHQNDYDEIVKKLNDNVDNINNLLKLFDFREGTFKESIDINEVINQVVNFFRPQKSEIEFSLNLSQKIPRMVCHKASFSMVIYNIINNAIQAMEENLNQPKISIKTSFEDKMYSISIQDNGKGIDNDDIEKIFDFGFTTKDQGIGIGLYFVRKVIEDDFHGEIYPKSKKGSYTVMNIAIPEYINYLKD